MRGVASSVLLLLFSWTVDPVAQIERLRSSKQWDRERAETELADAAKLSSETRSEVVASVSKLLSSPDAPSETRKGCMRILGDLQATEAIDLLVEHLTDLHGLTGLSEHYYPALQALHKIGPPAIPALSKALRSGDPKTRRYAAQTLGLIGGKTARQHLQQALTVEHDETVRFFIQRNFAAMDR